MTSIPASRSDLAMILAPRSWPSRPGFATTTRMGPLIAGRVYTRSRLRRREHDQDREVGGDRVEAVVDVRGDEDDRPRVDRTILVSYPDPAVPGDDVVELVLVVRGLRIGLAGTQDVEADAHRVAAQELMVELARRGPHGVDPVDLEDVHPRDPTEDRAGNRGQAPHPRGLAPALTVVDHQGLAVVQRAVRDAVRAVALGEAVALGDPGPARRRAVRHDREADQPEAVEARLVARLVHRLEAVQARREHAGAGAGAAVDD